MADEEPALVGARARLVLWWTLTIVVSLAGAVVLMGGQ